MTASEIKELIKDIPEENWMRHKTINTEDKCCVIGHVYRITHVNGNYNFDESDDNAYDNMRDFDKKVTEFFRVHKQYDLHMNFFEINDHKTEFYKQETPKERVLALLDEMIDKGY